jgi:hypothetical protein
MQHPVGDTELDQGVVAVPSAALPEADLWTLPSDGFFYGLDCPGTNLGGGWEDASWFDEWDRIQGHGDPSSAPHPPVHLVHFAWFDRTDDLLLVQYWFFYPYDKYVNNHEGDWEHVSVVVRLSGDPELVDAHFHFHGSSTRQFERITRITDDAGGDHVVVFTSGCSEFDGWGGCYSGASWPWTGLMWMVTLEDTRFPERYLHPDDIGVILLPERDQVVGGEWDPEVSWAPLLLYFGEWETEANHPAIILAEGNQVPTPPPFKGSFGKPAGGDWPGENLSEYEHFLPPDEWEVLYNPGHERARWPE